VKRRTARMISVAAAAATIAVVTVGCGGDDGAESTTTTADGSTTTTAEVATTTTAEVADNDGGIEGSWVADANDLIAANTANLGDPGGLECSGRITMTFADGKLNRSGEVSCGASGSPLVAEGSIETSGRYAVEGDTITVSETESSGRANLAGTEIPTPDSWGDGTAIYSIEGDTLAIEFTETLVGEVTQNYTRAPG